MPNKLIPYVKVLLHLLCLVPFFYLLQLYRSGELATETDPVSTITHLTGKWALWILIASLAVTPLRRLHPKLGNLIRFRRMIGLYAFFYATLHLATYMFLFSGYDVPTAYASVKSGHLGELWRQWVVVWPVVKDDLVKRKFVQIGLFAWVVLLALAVTSPARVLRVMGGKSWQRLHRLVYAAAIAGCLHYWWLVKAGVRSPLPDTLALTVLLLARVGWVLWKRQKSALTTKADPLRG